MSKNPYGAPSRRNMEWGSKARKEEDRLRGNSAAADREIIAEQTEAEEDHQ